MSQPSQTNPTVRIEKQGGAEEMHLRHALGRHLRGDAGEEACLRLVRHRAEARSSAAGAASLRWSSSRST